MGKMKFEKTSKRLSQALASKDMTQQELANLSGINKASISQYINGRNRPNNISAHKMSRYLEVKPEWLMGFDTDQNISIEFDGLTPENYERLVAYYNKLMELQRMEEK